MENRQSQLENSPVQSRVRWWQAAAGGLLVPVELSWLIPWYKTIMPPEYPQTWLRTGLVLGAILFGGLVIAQAIQQLRLIESVGRGLQIGLLAAGLFLASRTLSGAQETSFLSRLLALELSASFITLVVVWSWWRGLSLGRRALDPSRVWGRVRFGLVMLALWVFVASRLEVEGVPQEMSFIPFILFLITGLMAMIMARIAFISSLHGAARNPFDRQWLSIIGSTVGGIVFLAVLVGWFFTSRLTFLLDALNRSLGWLAAILGWIAAIPALLLSFLIEPFIDWSRQQAAVLPTPTPAPTQFPGEMGEGAGEVLVAPGVGGLPPWLFPALFWGLVAILLLVFILRARREFAGRRRGAGEVETVPLEGQDLLSMLRNAFRDRWRETTGALGARLSPASRVRAAARIRQIYTNLLELAEDLGRPRLPAQTPLEFLPALGNLFPEYHADLSLITQAYLKVRYGELPETQEEINALEAAWQRVNTQGKRAKAAREP